LYGIRLRIEWNWEGKQVFGFYAAHLNLYFTGNLCGALMVCPLITVGLPSI